ncbi:MAG: universal stress protein [Myxococcota bacterium]
MTVIFGTTLEPESERLAAVAAHLAAKLGEPLRLVHVSQDLRAPLVLGTDQEPLLGSVRRDLERQAAKLQRDTAAQVRPHLAAGPIVDALASLAELELATVVVVGASTWGVRHTDQRLSQASPVPALALREPERLAAWLRGERPLRVLVGADAGSAATAARAFAARLTAAGPVQVEVLHVAETAQTHARLGLAAPEREGAFSPEAEAALMRELSKAAPTEERGATVRLLAARGRPNAHLVAHAAREDMDLVIVGRRRPSVFRRLWQGSVAHEVLRDAPVSVATVPPPIEAVEARYQPPRAVVVGVEQGDPDAHTLRHALGYAEQGATVHVAHVIEAASPDEDRRQRAEAALGRLLRRAERDADARSLDLRAHVLEGRPADQLLALSERAGADLVVLGSRSRSAVGGALMGSVAQELVRSCSVPVLLVPVPKA